MLIIDKDLTMHVTRGDAGAFDVSAKDKDTGEVFKFEAGDIVRFKVYERKDCNCVVLSKDTKVTEATEEVTIYLESSDTKIGEPINKPKDYSFEVEVNPDTAPNTIIGHDKDGPKTFKLYPEGGDPK